MYTQTADETVCLSS